MSVEDIVVASGVSRRTFYDNYRGKEDAFLAAYDEVSAQLLGQVQEAYNSADGLVDRARESLRALLDFIASEPTFADMCIVEVLAAGPQAIARRNTIMSALAALIDQAAEGDLPKSKRPAPIIAETLVGGIYEVIYSRVLAGRYTELPSLLPDLVFALLQPYVGTEVAQEILKRNGAGWRAPRAAPALSAGDRRATDPRRSSTSGCRAPCACDVRAGPVPTNGDADSPGSEPDPDRRGDHAVAVARMGVEMQERGPCEHREAWRGLVTSRVGAGVEAADATTSRPTGRRASRSAARRPSRWAGSRYATGSRSWSSVPASRWS